MKRNLLIMSMLGMAIAEQQQVIVIGAGIAGLAAARTLVDKAPTRFNVTVLEARDRVGGRIWTAGTGDSGVFDLGASWIHGSGSENPITELRDTMDVTTETTDDDSMLVLDQAGEEFSEIEMETTWSQYRTYVETAFEDGADLDEDESLQTYVYRNTQWKNFFQTPIANFHLSNTDEFNTGASWELLSVKCGYDDEEFDGTEELFPGGYRQIIDGLVSGAATGGSTAINVVKNQQVTSIERTGGQTKVYTSTGEVYSADVVIVTVPLGVLKRNGITFSPALSTSKAEAISRVGYGNVNKLVLEFETAFWPEASSTHYYGLAVTDTSKRGLYTYFLNAVPLFGLNGVMTFGLGDNADEADGMTLAERVQVATENMRLMFGLEETPVPTMALSSNWSSDPFAYGTYSYGKVDQDGQDDIYELGLPECDSMVYFAGEATSLEYRGSVHGGYLTGQRVAQSLIDNTPCEDFDMGEPYSSMASLSSLESVSYSESEDSAATVSFSSCWSTLNLVSMIVGSLFASIWL
eukprot:TRINITY_DN11634_c0_g1::TRINITY_DN11634_c0_g1_i1::g.17479::m.17479 TRINITY_DN11634_c0_g1::TRINITY_DN11634_c0_g1_i1::g.17479  ORF type:complete len:522 (+),score=102.48,sp/Q8H191/PAO4_ARATH/31.95/8e-52,Amino_oxidase/PF01593.19/8.3e-78,NAD_binding_8/PF13450.1/1.1e-14,DAO/PF01266.19/1e-05,DAO/PF01266.19/0.047,NAD_binding_9/PF13454.1/0.00037,NAD_binding_9/PF13454.1/0.27,HI0933_like/PF03486.9/5.1e-05,HI0933_like/PF03486.9/21,Thi4/PF01946.12/3e-05,Pyr_redox_3/PF13738.1/0.00092,Pyr_redox_3/PF13738.1/18,